MSEGKAGSTTVITLTITLSAPSTEPVTVTVGVTGGTATSGTDYTAVAPTTLTFAPGQTTLTYTIIIKGDKTKELERDDPGRAHECQQHGDDR